MNHYTQPQPSYSPGTRPYPLPASYSTYRYPYGDDQLARQVHYLEGQVRSLADALHYTQQESAAARAMSYDALQSLIGVVASLDPDGRRAEERESRLGLLSRPSRLTLPSQSKRSLTPFRSSMPTSRPARRTRTRSATPRPARPGRPATAPTRSQRLDPRPAPRSSTTTAFQPSSRTLARLDPTLGPTPLLLRTLTIPPNRLPILLSLSLSPTPDERHTPRLSRRRRTPRLE